MATQVELTAERRTATGRSAVRKIKASGAIPAVIYGAKTKPELLQVSKRDMGAILSHSAGGKASRLALVQEVQHAPVGGHVLHVDFHAVSMDEVIEAEVPLEPTGTANGVKNFGGLLEQNLRSLEIECLPRDLPDRITVDVSELNIGDSIHVRQISLPPGVTTKVPADLTVFSVLAPTVEEEPVAAVAEAAAAGPEVIREKKAEGAEGAAVATAAPAPKDKEQKK